MNLITGFLGEFVIYIVNFAVRTVFIRILGKNYLGIGGLFINIMTMLSLADMGIGTALGYRLYKPLKDNDTERLKSIMHFYKYIYQLIGIIILLLGFSLIPLLKYMIKDFDTFATLGLSAGVVFSLYLMQSVSTYCFFAYKSAIVKANQKEYYINIAMFCGAVAAGVSEIIVLYYTHNYLFYLSVNIALNILIGYIYACIANRMFPFLQEKCSYYLSKQDKINIFKDCGAISLFSISSVVLKATDNLVLAKYVGLAIVGLYSNYLMIYNALKKIIKKVIRSAQASIGNLFANASENDKYTVFRQINFIMVLLCGTASVCVAVLSDEFIITWIGDEYLIPMPFALLMAIELYTIGSKLILEQMRDTIGFFQKLRWRPVIEVILNISISITLVRKYSIYGVIIGTLISEWLTVFIIDPYIVFKYGFGDIKVWHYYYNNLMYILELVAIGIFNYWFILNIFAGYGWLSFLLHSIICSISVLCCLCICNCGSMEFKTVLQLAHRTLKGRC